MTRPRTLALAAACTLAGAGGALGVGAISSAARGGGHDHRFGGQRGHHAARVLGRAVHATAVVPQRDGTFADVTFDRGTVKGVSGQDLTIADGTRRAVYKDVTITIPADARIRRGHRRATLADLRAGDRVAVIQGPRQTFVLAAPARETSPR